MKKLILILSLLILLSGCGIYNLNFFTLPDDSEFLTLVQELDTPEKICQYMLDNFTIEEHPYMSLTPYRLYIIKKGDCDDFSNFARFMANCHGYETYQIIMSLADSIYKHSIAIYKENGYYTFSELQYYNPYNDTYNSFAEIMSLFNGWSGYIVYDYWNGIVEQAMR